MPAAPSGHQFKLTRRNVHCDFKTKTHVGKRWGSPIHEKHSLVNVMEKASYSESKAVRIFSLRSGARISIPA
jgi:hypothetical protein